MYVSYELFSVIIVIVHKRIELENGVTISIVISVTFVIVTVIVIVICDRHVAGVIQ